MAARNAIKQLGACPYLIRQVGKPVWMRVRPLVTHRPIPGAG